MSFAPDMGHHDVPDPYYDGRYNLVYDLVNKATQNLLDTIKKERGL
jgi:protein-tyrosine phosphatase